METYTSTAAFQNSGQSMLAGTSPAASPGGYEVAFQSSGTDLFVDALTSLTATTGTVANLLLGMMKGTSPAI